MVSLTAQQKGLLDAKLAAAFVPHLPPLLVPKGGEDDRVKNLSRSLAAMAVSALCEVEPTEAAQSVVDDYDDYGLDAIYYHASAETLYLVQGKLKAGATFSQVEANGFAQGIRKIIRQDFSGFNANVTARQTAIEDAVENCSRIELVVIHIGSGMSAHGDDALCQLIQEEGGDEERLCANYTEIDADRVAAYLHDSGAYPRVDASVHLKSAVSRNEGRKTYIGFVAAERLELLHREHGKALFAKNIRQHLGHKTDVNAAIRETLAERPAEFEYLNNGVTILADRINSKNNNALLGRKLNLSGMSIINGAQTVASIAGFVADNPGVDISAAFVPVTVIQADQDVDFSKRVTRTRNHQNPVFAQNFAALDDHQETLRRDLALLGYHYAYKPEALDDAADPSRIRIEEAAQALAVAQRDPRFAVYLKKEPGQLLLVGGAAYNTIFKSGLSAYRLLNAVLFFRFVQARMLTETRAAAGFERLVYKHGVYALGFILAKQIGSHLDGATAIDSGKIAAAASAVFDSARQHLLDAVRARSVASDKGPLSIMRNGGEAIPVLGAAMVAQFDRAGDPVLAHKSRHVAGEPYPVALFEYLADKAPAIVGLT